MPQKCHIVNCVKPAVAKGLCDTHRKRKERTGSTEIREDWGSREKHRLYPTWHRFKRYSSHDVSDAWKNDFWAFVKDVPEKPEGSASAQRFDESKPWSADNFYWRESRLTRGELESKADYARRWQQAMRDADPDYERNKKFIRTYGVTVDWYNERSEEQNHVCAICNKPETMVLKGRVARLAIDHCHDTGKVRGLLCTKCNRAIGMLGHDQGLLFRAIEYLEKHK